VQATGRGPSVPADGAVLVNTQYLLNENWDRNLEVDGVYGPDTEAEIREIQRDTFGEDEDDGIIGLHLDCPPRSDS
jgi:peptidoglycan hydrolase-like protein with peptidoglycan-binding domain